MFIPYLLAASHSSSARSPEEAGDYVRTLQTLLRAVGSSDGSMELVGGSFMRHCMQEQFTLELSRAHYDVTSTSQLTDTDILWERGAKLKTSTVLSL